MVGVALWRGGIGWWDKFGGDGLWRRFGIWDLKGQWEFIRDARIEFEDRV